MPKVQKGDRRGRAEPTRWLSLPARRSTNKLRDHLSALGGTHRKWPPKWLSAAKYIKPEGEVGTLEHVVSERHHGKKIFIFMDHEGDQYLGVIEFDDPEFCRGIYALLRSHVGCSIKEIGDLDLPATF